MDLQRIEAVVAEQVAAGLPGLARSEATTILRLSDAVLNQIVAASLPDGGVVRTVTLQVRGGNLVDATVVLNKPSFLPALHVRFAVERQAALPDDPVLTLRMSGGGATLFKLAEPFLGGSMSLPPGVGLEHDLLRLDVRAVLEARGLAAWLRFVRELVVTTEESTLVVAAAFKV
jgi:hypothetical protein